jgi:hypothetical protein
MEIHDTNTSRRQHNTLQVLELLTTTCKVGNTFINKAI